MAKNKDLSVEIALFGESGSGKTVLLSSFYGRTQEKDFHQKHNYSVCADELGHHSLLHKNYLGMRNSAVLPEATRFKAQAYPFSIRHSGIFIQDGTTQQQSIHLTWHDYPGEWLEQDVSGDEEQKRRIETFRNLMGADVAFFLVDAQKLLDNAGEEERYLKALFMGFSNALDVMKKDILGKKQRPLDRYPRIWVIALSKADLLPDMDVYAFRDLVTEKSGYEITCLGKTLQEFVTEKEALSVGEDFLLLSSARFEPGSIDFSDSKGVSLMIPMSSVFPYQRLLRWAERYASLVGFLNKHFTLKNVMDGVGIIATVATVVTTKKLPTSSSRLGRLAGWANSLANRSNVISMPEVLAPSGSAYLEARHKAACENQDFLGAVLSGFALELEQAEKDEILLRGNR